ncbi:MAG: hypothetical protein K8U57_12310 [Planctomycetes bacterium]|nr:hypothetical protein [Planctomycetota bacterium]
MKVIMLAAALLLTAAQSQLLCGQETKTEEAVKCTVEHLDKSWNLAVKSVVTKEVTKEALGDTKFNPAKKFVEIRITLEFADEAASPKEMKRRFVTESNMPKVGEVALKEPQTQLWLFDGDGVELKKFEPWSLEGEITGVQGDAFRVVIYCDPELFKKTKKIDLRPASK